MVPFAFIVCIGLICGAAIVITWLSFEDKKDERDKFK